MGVRKVLVVDGDAATRKYVASVLTEQGCEVLSAGSAREGLIAAWRDHPDLIVADPMTADLAGEEFAARLRSDPRTSRLPLVALSSDPKPARQISCLQAGFDDYLVKSPRAIPALVEQLGRLLPEAAAAPQEGGILISFLSAKGGTGTSSLCANLAMNLSEDQPKAKVVVADLVLPIGSIAGIVGYTGRQNLVNVTHRKPSETSPLFLGRDLEVVAPWGFHLLAGAPNPDQANELNGLRIAEVIAGLRTAYDFVILDVGRSLSRISLPLIQNADLVVMVVANDVSTVTLSRTVLDYLCSKGLDTASVYLILNRAVGLEGLTKAEAEKILGLPIHAGLPHLAGNLTLANNQHQPYSIKYPTDTATIVLKDTARDIVKIARSRRA